MSEIIITATVVMAGVLAAILLWQVLEIGKEWARQEGHPEGKLQGKVEALEGRLEALEVNTRSGSR